MKSYRLNIKVLIVSVGIFSLFIFSLVLIFFHVAKFATLGEILLSYAYIIAPISLLWIFMDNYLWRTKLFQSINKSLNVPPDLRGRWEGTLENTDGSGIQQFVIEIRQTLTTLSVHSYSSMGSSASLLCEIASNENEDKFTLCFLWHGEISTSMKDIHSAEQFFGYTMLTLYDHEKPKILMGPYFTNRISLQTRGGIQLKWISNALKQKIE